MARKFIGCGTSWQALRSMWFCHVLSCSCWVVASCEALVVASSIEHFPNMLLQLLDQIQPCQEAPRGLCGDRWCFQPFRLGWKEHEGAGTSLGRSFAVRKFHIFFFVFNDPWKFFFFFFQRKLDPLIRLPGLHCLKRWPLHFTDTSLGRIRTWSLKNHEGVVWCLMHSSYCKTGVKLLLARWQTLHKVQWLYVFRGFLSVFKFSVCFWMFVNRTEAYLPAPLDGHQTRRRPAFGAFAAGGNGGGGSLVHPTFCWFSLKKFVRNQVDILLNRFWFWIIIVVRLNLQDPVAKHHLDGGGLSQGLRNV